MSFLSDVDGCIPSLAIGERFMGTGNEIRKDATNVALVLAQHALPAAPSSKLLC